MEDLEVILDDIESQEAEVTDLNYIPDYQVYEQERRGNEAERIANENERKDNEVTRVGNEETRVDNESTRVGNESDRVTAEGLRVSAEEGRVEAEADRVLAEEHREEVINSLSDVATSGSYNDLSDKPYIPENTSDLTNDSGYITKDVNNLTYYTIKTSTGSLIDLEINSTTYVVTLKLKDIDGNVISTDTIDLPLENVVVSGRYDNATKKVILTLQNGSEVSFSVADLVSGLQTEITNDNKIASDLVDDSNSGHKFVTTTEKSTWNGKQNLIDNSHKLSSDLVDDSGTNKFVSASDITNWNNKVSPTDYATSSTGGVIKTDSTYGLGLLANGTLVGGTATYSAYNSGSNARVISKGTLENVITGKNLETANNKVSTIDENSTNTQYVGAKCVYDSQVAQDTQITQLQAENDYLNSVIEQAFDETTQTGETISIDNTIQAKMKVGLNGNTSQVQYTGKNLINFATTETITLNKDFTASLPIGTYTISCSNISTTTEDTTFMVQLHYTGGTNAYFTLNKTSKKGTFTTTDECDYIRLYSASGYQSSVGVTTTYTNLMLETGSSPTDYEPYCGGIPSPNPSYPQRVEVVSGDNEVSVCGKNLLNSNLIDNHYVWTYGTAGQVPCRNSNNNRATLSPTNAIEVKPNTTYTINHNTTWRLAVAQLKEDGVSLGDSGWKTYTSMPYTITTNANCKYVGFNFSKGDDTSISDSDFSSFITSDLVFKEGTNSTYDNGDKYQVNLPVENLFNPTYQVENQYTANGSAYTSTGYTLNNNVISISKNYGSVGRIFLNKITLPSGNYKFSYIPYLSGDDKTIKYSIRDMVNLVDIVSATSHIITDGVRESIIQFTLENETTISISIQPNTSDSPLLLEQIQLTKGVNTTNYTPYGLAPIELCKITDYKDYFYKNIPTSPDYSSDRELDAWYLKKNIGKVVLDGSENWDGITDLGNNIRAYFTKSNIKLISPGYSNYFLIEIGTYNTDSTGILFTPFSVSIIAIKIPKSVLSSADKTGIQNWLSNNNTTCYYLYNTSQHIKITGVYNTLNTQLENIYNAMSKKGQTNISQVNNDKPFIIDAWALTKGSE